MESLERIRDKSTSTTILILIRSHLINGLEIHLRANISPEEGWQWTTSNESETHSFQQQYLVLISNHLVNGLELPLHPNISTEGGWQWTASNE